MRKILFIKKQKNLCLLPDKSHSYSLLLLQLFTLMAFHIYGLSLLWPFTFMPFYSYGFLVA